MEIILNGKLVIKGVEIECKDLHVDGLTVLRSVPTSSDTYEEDLNDNLHDDYFDLEDDYFDDYYDQPIANYCNIENVPLDFESLSLTDEIKGEYGGDKKLLIDVTEEDKIIDAQCFSTIENVHRVLENAYNQSLNAINTYSSFFKSYDNMATHSLTNSYDNMMNNLKITKEYVEYKLQLIFMTLESVSFIKYDDYSCYNFVEKFINYLENNEDIYDPDFIKNVLGQFYYKDFSKFLLFITETKELKEDVTKELEIIETLSELITLYEDPDYENLAKLQLKNLINTNKEYTVLNYFSKGEYDDIMTPNNLEQAVKASCNALILKASKELTKENLY